MLSTSKGRYLMDMANAPKALVVVVDNDKQRLSSITKIVESVGHEIQLYDSAESYLKISHQDLGHGCIIANMDLPGISGLDLVNQINQHSNQLPLILLSHQPSTASIVKAMKLGAVSLLEIPIQENLLFDSISEAILRSGTEFTDRQQRKLVKSRLQQLTEKERIVIHLLIDGLANKVVANRLGVSVRTIETRRHDIFQKMKVNSLIQLVSDSITIQCIKEFDES